MKKISAGMLILPIILLAAILVSCSNPDGQYRKQIEDALTKYESWNQESVNAYNKMQEAKTSGNPKVTYGELITNTIQNHITGDTRRADLTWNMADYQLVKGQVKMVFDGARPLLTELEGMNPPESVKDAHSVLQECVKYEMNIAATIYIFLNDNKFEPVNYKDKPCDQVDTAITTLKAFAEAK